ncbi:MAG: DUF58 domain-containing protein [Cuniculiplasma sp.]
MMKKRAYGILTVLYGGLFESFIYGLYGYQVLTYIFIAMIITVCSDIILLHAFNGKTVSMVRVKRYMAREEMKKGDKIRVELTFTNPTSRNMSFYYFDMIPDAFEISGDFEGKISIGAGKSEKKVYYIVPGIIGKYSLGPVKVIVSDGLGLAFQSFSIEKYSHSKVGPSSDEVFMERSERMSNMVFTTGVHFSRRAGQGYDFFGLRAYNETDDMRHVAWNRFNMYGNDDLFAKEWEEDRQIDVIFCIDYSIGSNSGFGVTRMFDAMVASAMNSAYAVLKNSDKVGFIIYSTVHNIYIPPSSRKDSIDRFGRTVSSIRPDGSFSLDGVNSFIKKVVKKNAMVFVYSSPSYGKFTGKEVSTDIYTGKQEYYYILNPDAFYPVPDSESLRVYRRGILSNEFQDIRKSVNSIRSFGINARMVARNKIFSTTMTDYITGREGNRGA